MQGSKLYVGNLNYSVTNEQLEELFSAHGNVQSAKVIGDKGFGFVEMGGPGESRAAMKKLNGKEVAGSRIRVKQAQ